MSRPWAVAIDIGGDVELVREFFPTAAEAERFGAACFSPMKFVIVRIDQ